MKTETLTNSNTVLFPKARSISGRPDIDFLLLGGLSVFFFFFPYIFQPIQSSWSISRHLSSVSWTFLNLSLLCNYPHFMASYRLSYGQGRRFIFQYWIQLILVPFLLISTFSILYFAMINESFRGFLNQVLTSTVGFEAGTLNQVLLTQTFSNVFINLMFLTVGWHYSKQVYGVMMSQAHFAEYPLTLFQKRVCWLTCTSIWIANFVFSNASPHLFREYYDAKYSAFFIPLPFQFAAIIFFALASSAFLVFVLLRNFRLFEKRPSLRFFTPLLAFVIWWFPFIPRSDAYNHMVPFFHSLQYLVFVHAIELMQSQQRSRTEMQAAWKYWAIVAIYLATGLIFFELLPNFIDVRLGVFELTGIGMFFLFFTTFINTHHYFIDNALWRRDGKMMKEYIAKL